MCLFYITLILSVDRSHLKKQIKKYEKQTKDYERQIEDLEREISRLSRYHSKDATSRYAHSKDTTSILPKINDEEWKRRMQRIRDAEVL